jgi:hypothetical protein
VAGELDSLVVLELESLLESPANLQKGVLALLLSPALALFTRDGTTNGTSPQTNTIESSSNVDNHAHDLVVFIILNVLANGGEHNVQPERVDVDGLLVLELECPFATMLVLRIFPLGSYTLLEEMVVGLEGEVGGWGDVVLSS